MAELVLVFDKHEFPDDLQGDIHHLACEAFSGECHVPWTSNGAKQGQRVLIHNWW